MAPKNSNGFPTYRTAQIMRNSSHEYNDGVFVDTSNDKDLDNLEVDYDNNVTDLYNYISNSQWQEALAAVRNNPIEARTWVVRYHEDSDQGMMWRFLPIHSAAARQPPEAVIQALIQAYPKGVTCCDDQGKYALHYAAGNQASAGVIRSLIHAFPTAATTSDPEGKIPIHWMAISGPFEPSAIAPLVEASKQLYNIVDDEGWTPLEYAYDSTYPYKQEMIDALKDGDSPRKRMPISSIPTDLPHDSMGYPSPLSVFSNFSPRRQQGSSAYGSGASVRSVNTAMSRGTTNKTIAKYKAQIVKLKAELAYNRASHEEKVMNQQEEHDDEIEKLDSAIDAEIEKGRRAKEQLNAKNQYIMYKEQKITSCDKELAHFNEVNARLSAEIETLSQQMRNEKNTVGEYKLRITSLQTKMKDMSRVQENITKSLEALEADAQKASELRRKKLQALFDEEMKEQRELKEMKKVYGNLLGGPTIREALAQQKNLMKNCEAVLEDCEVRDNVDAWT